MLVNLSISGKDREAELVSLIFLTPRTSLKLSNCWSLSKFYLKKKSLVSQKHESIIYCSSFDYFPTQHVSKSGSIFYILTFLQIDIDCQMTISHYVLCQMTATYSFDSASFKQSNPLDMATVLKPLKKSL